MARRRERPTWRDGRVHNGLVILFDTAGRAFEVIDLGKVDTLRKLPDPPAIRRRPATKRRTPTE